VWSRLSKKFADIPDYEDNDVDVECSDSNDVDDSASGQ
jgi:hypothetical protein